MLFGGGKLKRVFLLAVVVLLSAFFIREYVQASPKKQARTSEQSQIQELPEIIVGSPDAPVTIIEYSSLTCGHCAIFHTEVLPKLHKKFIKTGRVRILVRDFPLDPIALRGSQIAWGRGAKHYIETLETIFEEQEEWLYNSEDMVSSLDKVARTCGLTQADVDRCTNDLTLMNGILKKRLDGNNTYTISGTPTFIINGKEHTGALSEASFVKAIIEAEKAEKANS
ncbi:MAG: DsbA family protein [Alphaproteobacteria bacterium]|nr:DsbA family protein [Alphaproteobacteria bacterium]MBT5390646.1 DsbA family protein [Alphaproteobacteria bacterium]MBT5540258.1 DsbA family protein [Alphaproteobacteria bacterium]